jgi:adenylate kinase
MRVVFTGTSGTDNRHVVRRLADYITRQHGRKVAVIEAERELREMGAGEYYQFLDSIPSNDAARQWSQSVKGAISEWAQENRRSGEPEFSFLSMHLVFQVRSHFHCPINWSYPTGDAGGITKGELLELLREFNPHLFINLIDNVYSLQRRIKDYPFRLIELLRWRNVETLMTDIVASLVIEEKDRIRETPENISRYKYERSPILAIRHPMQMAYRLISDEGITRIYMAYPISEPRTVHRTTGDDRLIRQINAFRDYMRAHFVAFDPVTIDERPLKFLWEVFVTGKRKNLRNKRSLTKDALIREVYSLIAGDTTLSLAEKDTWPVDPAEYQHMLCGPLDH